MEKATEILRRNSKKSKNKREIQRKQSRTRSTSSSEGKDIVKRKRKKPPSKRRRRSSSSSTSSSTSSSPATSSSTSSSSSSDEKRKYKKKQKKKKTKEPKTIRDKTENDATCDIPLDFMDKSKTMAPMTKEQWEKEQNTVKRVYDESTGRWRLVKGSGEVIEEIVSKERHKAINQQATKGDGEFFQAKLLNDKK